MNSLQKFFVLLKKELRELLTPYMLIPLVITVFIFFGLGKVMGNQTEKLKAPQEISVIDQDNSSASKAIIDLLNKSNLKVNLTNLPVETALDEAKAQNRSALLIIPDNFGRSLTSEQPEKLTTYAILTSFSMSGSISSQTLDIAIKALNVSPRPILTTDHVVVGDRQANIRYTDVMGFVNSQSYFIPIILFLIIIFASQMIATSIASEKENKTLETLLSSPVSRQYIVCAKLLAAGLVSLLFSGVYVFSMRYYMDGISGGAMNASVTEAARAAINQLGLSFGNVQYVLLGFSLFFGILSGLAISLILGAFVEDVKSVQAAITPLMILVMIPYFLVMFLDVSTLPTIGRWALYAIPFSHPFLAIQYLLLHDYPPVLWGILYQAIVFVLFVYLASWIFSTDHIMTLRLGKKKV